MLDSDGSSQKDDRHHRQSRSRPAVCPGWTGETPAEREEQQLAEAAVLVGLPAEQPQAAPNKPEPPAPEPGRAAEAAPAAQAAAPAVPPLGGDPDAQEAPAPAPARHAMAPGTPQARGTGPAGAPSASPGTATAAAEGREGAKYRAHNKPSHTHTSLPKPYPPKAAVPEGRSRPGCPPTPKRTSPGITLPQQRVVQEGGNRDRAGRDASHGGAGRGAQGNRGRKVRGGGGQAPGGGKGAGSSAGGHTQGQGQGARSDERGQRHGQGASASRSRGGQAEATGKGKGSVRRHTGHGKGQARGTRRMRAPAEKARARVTEGGTRDTSRGAGRRSAPERGAGGREGAQGQGDEG